MATVVEEPMDQRPVSRGVLAWGGDEEAVDTESARDEELTPEELSLELALMTRCFEGFEGKRMTYLNTTQLTCSNVMSTIVTARPIDTSTKRKSKAAAESIKNSNRSNQETSSSSSHNSATHVYAQACNPKKVKKKNGKYQAQLPAFRRSLPALPVPVNRLNQELVQERDKFMKQLYKEREEKKLLDNWAATKIQACYRGYRGRPRVISFETRQKLNTLSSIRLDLTEMEDSLKKTSLDDTTTSKQPEAKPPGSPEAVSPWRKEIQSRAGKKVHFRARNEHLHQAATVIQASIKRYLARFTYAHLLARHYDEVYLASITCIQSVFRGFRLRSKIMTVVAKLQSQAAIQIQRLIRGIQARERVCTLTFERKCEELRRAGQPLQFTLPSRTPDIVHTSSLRCLFEHRKVNPNDTEFKSPQWHEERMLLRIYKVSIKLNLRRQWLLRWNMPSPTTKQRKKRTGLLRTLSRMPSRLNSSRNIGSGLGSSPSSPMVTRRRPEQITGSSSRPASPSTWQARTKTSPHS